MKNYILSSSLLIPVADSPKKGYSVAVSGGKILDVGKTRELTARYKSFEKIDLGTGLLLPGFINSHVHLELEWIRDFIGNFSDFTGWLEYIMRAKANNIGNNDITSSVKNGISSLLHCGVSTVGEISSYGEIDSDVLRSSPLRTVLYKEIVDSNLTALRKSDFGVKDNLFEVRPFPHAPYSCSPEVISESIDKSLECNIPFAIHLAESKEEAKFVKNISNKIENDIYPLIGKTPFTRYTADTPLKYITGLRNPWHSRMTAIHMVQVEPDELEIIKELDIGIVICPRSNLLLKVGEPPLGLYSKLNRIGIGTDGLSSNTDLDFFEELRCFNSIADRYIGEISPEFTVYAATLGGARSLFIEDRTGSIEPGKSADLLFLRADDLINDPYRNIVNSNADDIGFFMIGGKIIINGN